MRAGSSSSTTSVDQPLLRRSARAYSSARSHHCNSAQAERSVGLMVVAMAMASPVEVPAGGGGCAVGGGTDDRTLKLA